MNKKEALECFKEQIKFPCEDCGTPEGELCDTPGVWIHACRFVAYWKSKGVTWV